MQVTFNDDLLESFYVTPMDQLGSQGIDKTVLAGYRRKIDILANAADLLAVSKMNGLRLKKLQEEKYIGSYSIRINKQYRIIFKEGPDGKLSILVLELIKHYE